MISRPETRRSSTRETRHASEVRRESHVGHRRTESHRFLEAGLRLDRFWRSGDLLLLLLHPPLLLSLLVQMEVGHHCLQPFSLLNMGFKGTVRVISSDPPCKCGNASFTSVPLKLLFVQKCGR